MRNRGEELHYGTLPLVGWSDASYGDQLTEGKCRLGRMIGLMFPSLTGARHNLRRTSKFTWKPATSSPGGEGYALGKMVDNMALIRNFYEPSEGLAPGMVGLEACESLFTHLKPKKDDRGGESGQTFPEYPASAGTRGIGQNPAGDVTKVRSFMAPLLRKLESGRFSPGSLRPVKGVCPREATVGRNS